MSVKPPARRPAWDRSERQARTAPLRLVDKTPRKPALLGPDGVALGGESLSELRVGVQGTLHATGDRPAGATQLRRAEHSGHEPRAKQQRQAHRLGSERSDKPNNTPDRVGRPAPDIARARQRPAKGPTLGGDQLELGPEQGATLGVVAGPVEGVAEVRLTPAEVGVEVGGDTRRPVDLAAKPLGIDTPSQADKARQRHHAGRRHPPATQG